MKEDQIDIFTMKETFEAKLKNIILHSIYPNSFYCLWLPPQGQSGGILIGLNEAKLDLKDVQSIAFQLQFIFKSNLLLAVTLVYGPTQCFFSKLFCSKSSFGRFLHDDVKPKILLLFWLQTVPPRTS